MRIAPDMARELNELRDLASTQIVKPTLTDVLRAALRLGIPLLREELLHSKASPTGSEATAPHAHARSSPAARKKPKR